MAKKNRKEKKSKSERKVAKEEEAITWDDIAAMSDSDDEGGANNAMELNTKAKNLQQAITKNIGGMLALLKNTEGVNEEEFEEDVLDGSSSEEEEGDEDEVEAEAEDDEEAEHADSNDEEEKKADDEKDEKTTPSFIDKIKNKSAAEEDGESDSDSDSDDENKETKKKNEKYAKLSNNNNMNSKALSVVAAEANLVHSKMPWAETFVIVAPTPLPFGENGDPESNPLDIHDDLKREVAFYNTALEAINEARPKLQEANIPFTRPDDFFAEMVKTDGKAAQRKGLNCLVDPLVFFPNNTWFGSHAILSFLFLCRSHVQCEGSSHIRKQKDRSRGTTKVKQGTKTSCERIPLQPACRKGQTEEGSFPRTRRLGKLCCEESWRCSPRRRGRLFLEQPVQRDGPQQEAPKRRQEVWVRWKEWTVQTERSQIYGRHVRVQPSWKFCWRNEKERLWGEQKRKESPRREAVTKIERRQSLISTTMIALLVKYHTKLHRIFFL